MTPKTDAQVRTDVIAELTWDPAVDERRIGVAVNGGVATLSGTVANYMQKWAAERAARRVAGLRGLAIDLEVELAPGHKRSDAEIAEAAVKALDWNSVVPRQAVRVEVEDGWVTLSGKVDWSYQSRAAEHAVRALAGVRGIANEIAIVTKLDAAKIREQIAAAFARRAQRDAAHLAIDVDGSTVTLRGAVESLAEHDAAIGTAGAAPGVGRVIDRIEIAA